jgi:hypothetical protein
LLAKLFYRAFKIARFRWERVPEWLGAPTGEAFELIAEYRSRFLDERWQGSADFKQ